MGTHREALALSHEQAVEQGPIRRKARLVMRDPQQPAYQPSVSSFELPAFAASARRADGTLFTPGAEAAGVIEEARCTAEAMLAQTRAACEAELEAAQAAGYEAGYKAGMESADEESAALIRTAEQIGLHVATERERLLAAAEGELVELALVVAEKVVNASLAVDPSLVVNVCRGAMRKAFQRETLVVRAHPDDLELLRAAGPKLASELGGVQHLEFIEERRVQRGSLIVRTPAGEIDATFEGKLAKLSDELRELAKTRAAEQRNAA